MADFTPDAAFRFATDLAVRLGHQVNPHAGRDADGNKRAPDIDFTTQEAILQAILDEFPDTPFALCAEEDTATVAAFTGNPDDGAYRWVIDPIDGTNNFFAPQRPPRDDSRPPSPRRYSVSIALQQPAGPMAFGVLYFPDSEELFRAGPDTPAERNGHPLDRDALAAAQPLDDVAAMKIVGGPNRMRKLLQRSRHHGCATWSLMTVATGQADAWVFRRMNLWDIAAGLAILESAGGIIGLPDGSRLQPDVRAIHLDGFFMAAPNRAVLSSVYSWLAHHDIAPRP